MNYAKIDDLNAKKDELVTANDVIVLVDPKAIFFIAGTEMDFEVCILNRNLPYTP
jgi:Fe-S cluster assembly iron-binding protein IscA